MRIMHQKKTLPEYWCGGNQLIGCNHYQEIANHLIVDVSALAQNLFNVWNQMWKHGKYCTLDEELEKQKNSAWHQNPWQTLILVISSRSKVHDKPFDTSVLPHCQPKRCDTTESIRFAIESIRASADSKKDLSMSIMES
jgi:hypothetical protein